MIEEHVSFRSGELLLEGLLAYSGTVRMPRARILLCPPHPFLGGDMENNVIAHLSSVFVEEGYLVLRFNYRGIGNSESTRDLEADQRIFWEDSRCPEYETEMHTDCWSALHWIQGQLEASLPTHLVGYSFGCLPALEMTRQESGIGGCALISPPLDTWPVMPQSVRFRKPKALFYSPGDFACSSDRLQSLFHSMAAPKQLWEFDDADHFFIQKEQLLGEKVMAFMAGI